MAASGSLTAKQKLLIVTLLTEPTIAEAAAKAHVSERAAYRWLKLPLFVKALEHARQQQVETALDLLRSTLTSAIVKARALLESESPAIVLRARDLLLSHALKVRAEQTLTLQQVHTLQATVVDVLLSVIRELHLPEAQIRQRFFERFKALKEAGWPVVDLAPSPQPNGAAGNGHSE